MSTKQQLRERCWRALREAGAARFPGVEGRIPNFRGAEEAARRLQEASAWRRARVLKCNPDSPQRPVRRAALEQGKRVYLAAPRLAEREPFVELDPARIPADALARASSIRGAFELGRPLGLEEMEPIDLIVAGCVGVARDGARLGKGGGYSDLEYALLREAGLVGARTPVATTVHPSQILRRGSVPMTAHDVALDWIATPGELARCRGRAPRPPGILWEELDQERIRSIPVLAQRARSR